MIESFKNEQHKETEEVLTLPLSASTTTDITVTDDCCIRAA